MAIKQDTALTGNRRGQMPMVAGGISHGAGK